ncbi:MAG: DUF1330 domain-containing protein [Ktedonobacteraceae bacterium]|nr:DUF1330 domain-containing protein [Ktedonobacteraceae bacterium]
MATEERVQIAIENWAPRFVANGVDPNDVQRLTKRIERWADWSREWSACAAMHEQMGEQAEVAQHYQSAAYHYLHATMTYHFGKFLFVQHPEELRVAHEHVVHTYQKGLPYFDFPGERVAIPYIEGHTMYGIFRKPQHIANSGPGVSSGLLTSLASAKTQAWVSGKMAESLAVWRRCCQRLLSKSSWEGRGYAVEAGKGFTPKGGQTRAFYLSMQNEGIIAGSIVADIDITSPNDCQVYAQRTVATLEGYGRTFLVRSSHPETVEGDQKGSLG